MTAHARFLPDFKNFWCIGFLSSSLITYDHSVFDFKNWVFLNRSKNYVLSKFQNSSKIWGRFLFGYFAVWYNFYLNHNPMDRYYSISPLVEFAKYWINLRKTKLVSIQMSKSPIVELKRHQKLILRTLATRVLI